MVIGQRLAFFEKFTIVMECPLEILSLFQLSLLVPIPEARTQVLYGT